MLIALFLLLYEALGAVVAWSLDHIPKSLGGRHVGSPEMEDHPFLWLLWFLVWPGWLLLGIGFVIRYEWQKRGKKK